MFVDGSGTPLSSPPTFSASVTSSLFTAAANLRKGLQAGSFVVKLASLSASAFQAAAITPQAEQTQTFY